MALPKLMDDVVVVVVQRGVMDDEESLLLRELSYEVLEREISLVEETF